MPPRMSISSIPLPADPLRAAALREVFDGRLTPDRLREERHEIQELLGDVAADRQAEALGRLEGDRMVVGPRPGFAWVRCRGSESSVLDAQAQAKMLQLSLQI